MPTYVCANCGSDQVQAVPLLVAGGTAILSGTSTGVSFGGAGGQFGSAVTTSRISGTQTSALAARLAPPPRRTFGGRMIVIGLICLSLMGQWTAVSRQTRAGFEVPSVPILSMIFFATLALWLWRRISRDRKWNASEHPRLVERWERSIFCHRCGSVAELA